MNIIRAHTEEKDRDLNLEALLPDIFDGNDTITYEHIPEKSEVNTPDYHIQEQHSFIEVKAIVDSAHVARSAQWGRNIGNLQTFRDASPKLKLVKGVYSVNTPPVFTLPRDNAKLIAITDTLIEAIVAGLSTVVVHKKVQFTIHKIQDDGCMIHFSTSHGGTFDPSQTIFENIKKQVGKANTQLGYAIDGDTIERRMLLLVNEYGSGDAYNNDIVTALSYMFSDLASYSNIDEVWLQNTNIDGTHSNHLIVDRSFITDWQTGSVTLSENFLELLDRWLYALINRTSDDKNKAFDAIKKILTTNKPPHEIVANISTREQMLSLGTWLYEEKRYDDLMWLTQRFVDDPATTFIAYDGRLIDPSQDVKKGKDLLGINTVVGVLCWQLMYLATVPDKTVTAFEMVRDIAKGEHEDNLYVIYMLTYALSEISSRATILKKCDEEHGTSYLVEFRDIITHLIESYSKYSAIGNGLVGVFNKYPFIDDELADMALAKLRLRLDADVLFAQYAFYSPSLSQKHFRQLLTETIQDTDPNFTDLRNKIAWRLMRMVTIDDSAMFETVKPWLQLYIDRPYESEWAREMELVMTHMAKHDMSEVTAWLKRYIDNVHAFAEMRTEQQVQLLWVELTDVLAYSMRRAPQDTLGVILTLCDLWKQGAFIGDLTRIFGLYKEVQDQEVAQVIKSQLSTVYSELKALHLAIVDIDWG